MDYATLGDADTIGLTGNHKATKLLRVLQASITRTPENFNRCVDVLRKNTELNTLADKLVACRDRIKSETPCTLDKTVSLARGGIAVGASASIEHSFLMPPEKFLAFPAEAGATFAVSKQHSRTVVPPHSLYLDHPEKAARKNTQQFVTSPSLPSAPIPCSDPEYSRFDDFGARPQTNQQVRVNAETKCEIQIQRLQASLAALRIDMERKWSMKDLQCEELTLMCKELREQRDEFREQRDEFREQRDEFREQRDELKVYLSDLLQQLKFSEQDRISQVSRCEEEKESPNGTGPGQPTVEAACEGGLAAGLPQ